MALVTAPKFKRSVEFCSMAGPVDGVADGQMCHRLPAHHGEHNAFVKGNGVGKPKARKVAKKATGEKPKTITRGGVTYRLVAVKVAPVEPKAPAKKRAAKPRVRVIREAKCRHRVASSSGR